MKPLLAERVAELVQLGWEPTIATESTAALVGRRPFSWWLFLLVVVFFPLFGGVLYLIFWLATSRATVFLRAEDSGVQSTGDLWLINLQETNRDSYIRRQQAIKERGFLAVMWPPLLAFLGFLALWVLFLRWYF